MKSKEHFQIPVKLLIAFAGKVVDDVKKLNSKQFINKIYPQDLKSCLKVKGGRMHAAVTNFSHLPKTSSRTFFDFEM